MHLVGLHIYPVKSTAPTDLQRATVEPWGLAGDRRWLVVDPAGVQMTARERRRLLHVRAVEGGSRPAGTAITLTGPNAEPLTLDPSTLSGGETVAEIWDDKVAVTDAGNEAARWLSSLLEEPARLVYLRDPTARPITHRTGQPGEVVNMADSHPLLLATTGSLRQLNEWMGEDGGAPLPMRRFRPNVVIDSDEPFAEDRWGEVRIGGVTFRAGGGCSRCVLTTIDPETLAGGKEPIRTLARRHSWNHKTYFGINLTPTSVGEIALGDPVEVLSRVEVS
ncbi:MAG: hypothetical protein JWM76_2391 [Pseudonocardiales bacterium]|nr:hypothetical protein [Pseudonocardiales bacterium]